MKTKHLDEVENKGCGNCSQVLGGDIQMNREGRGGMYQEIEVFKFLRQMLDRSDNNWPVVLHNIRETRQVWGRLVKFLRREG